MKLLYFYMTMVCAYTVFNGLVASEENFAPNRSRVPSSAPHFPRNILPALSAKSDAQTQPDPISLNHSSDRVQELQEALRQANKALQEKNKEWQEEQSAVALVRKIFNENNQYKAARSPTEEPKYANILTNPANILPFASNHPDLINTPIEGKTLLHHAVENKDLNTVKKLLILGANPNTISTQYGITPLNLASYLGLKKIAQTLIDGGANVNLPDSHGNTPLYWALTNPPKQIKVSAMTGYGPLIPYHNSIPNEPTGIGQSLPIYGNVWYTPKTNIELLKLLLNNKVQIDKQSVGALNKNAIIKRDNPHIPPNDQNLDDSQALIIAYDISQSTSTPHTPFSLRTETWLSRLLNQNPNSILKILSQIPRDKINQPLDNANHTLLHMTAFRLATLAESRDSESKTLQPLVQELFQELVKYGADPLIQSKDGHTAIDILKQYKATKTLSWLENYRKEQQAHAALVNETGLGQPHEALSGVMSAFLGHPPTEYEKNQ
jgi:ankyrin repeat protein